MRDAVLGTAWCASTESDAPSSRHVLDALTSHRAVVLVDDVPHDAPASATRLRPLAQPFTAREPVAEIDRLVG